MHFRKNVPPMFLSKSSVCSIAPSKIPRHAEIKSVVIISAPTVPPTTSFGRLRSTPISTNWSPRTISTPCRPDPATPRAPTPQPSPPTPHQNQKDQRQPHSYGRQQPPPDRSRQQAVDPVQCPIGGNWDERDDPGKNRLNTLSNSCHHSDLLELITIATLSHPSLPRQFRYRNPQGEIEKT